MCVCVLAQNVSLTFLLLHVFTVQDGRGEFVSDHCISHVWLPLPLTGVFLYVVH